MKRTMNIKTGVLAALTALGVLGTTSLAMATGETCAFYNPLSPSTCMLWEPGLIPGGTWVNGGSYEPDADHVMVCDAPNYQGFCQALPLGDSVFDLAECGWQTETAATATHLAIQSAKMGPGRTLAVYEFPGNFCFGGTCQYWTGEVGSTGLPIFSVTVY